MLAAIEGAEAGRPKPSAAMFREAAALLRVDPKGVAFSGDRLRDALPASHFRGNGWLPESGYDLPNFIPRWTRRAPNLLRAVQEIIPL